MQGLAQHETGLLFIIHYKCRIHPLQHPGKIDPKLRHNKNHLVCTQVSDIS